VNKACPQRTLDFLFESAGPGCTYVLHSSLAISLQQTVRIEAKRLQHAEYHDWLFYAFARSHNFPWVIDSWPSMRYRQHANNQIGVNAGWKSFIYRARKVLNGHAFEQSLLISDVCHASSLTAVQRGLRSGRTGYLWLALHANNCRRKRIEQLWFFISCLLLSVVNPAIRGSE
jgi:rhamnosyltransferase